ncbi:alpha/beta hydrolase [Streptomyces sp. SID14515]|uniref:alpha/beta fold hydrolase n=1 Tax=Streptomyces sp. SID14515 TaxID=2706074 RepID=UPI0013C99C53|nr:alpha/beta hydrolase [Streptomyces sp. SID14515]NEB35818.1 alpha/beta hydrolase [Streptomyces sp. SID14515]
MDTVAVRTGRLEAPGATLHYEVRGRGPLLVMMPGGSADAGIYDALAAELADRWTVATFDPRGYSRSTLHAPVADQLPRTHSEDIARLIELLSPDPDGAPAAVFGSSSSAVVAVDLLTRHPGLVSRVVAHEPPLVELLPDPAAGRALFAAVRESFRRDGVEAAMATMAAGLAPDGAEEAAEAAPQASTDADPEGPADAHNAEGPTDVRHAEAPADARNAEGPAEDRRAGSDAGAGHRPSAAGEGDGPSPAEAATFRRMIANLPVFLEHVLCPFSGYVPDLAALRAAAPKLVVGVGRDSRALLPAVAAERLARQTGSRTVEFPGSHIGLTEDPVAFGARLRETLLA